MSDYFISEALLVVLVSFMPNV